MVGAPLTMVARNAVSTSPTPRSTTKPQRSSASASRLLAYRSSYDAASVTGCRSCVTCVHRRVGIDFGVQSGRIEKCYPAASSADQSRLAQLTRHARDDFSRGSNCIFQMLLRHRRHERTPDLELRGCQIQEVPRQPLAQRPECAGAKRSDDFVLAAGNLCGQRPCHAGVRLRQGSKHSYVDEHANHVRHCLGANVRGYTQDHQRRARNAAWRHVANGDLATQQATRQTLANPLMSSPQRGGSPSRYSTLPVGTSNRIASWSRRSVE